MERNSLKAVSELAAKKSGASEKSRGSGRGPESDNCAAHAAPATFSGVVSGKESWIRRRRFTD